MSDSPTASSAARSVFGKIRTQLSARNRYVTAIELLIAIILLIAAGLILVRGDKLPWLVKLDGVDDPIGEVMQAMKDGDERSLYQAAQRMRASSDQPRQLAIVISQRLRHLKLSDEQQAGVVKAIQRLYPTDQIGRVDEAVAYANIAEGLWRVGEVEAAVTFSMALIEHAEDTWQDETSDAFVGIIRSLSSGIRQGPPLVDEDRERVGNLLDALADVCDPGRTTHEEVRFTAAASLIGAMVAAGNQASARTYFRQWVEHARYREEPLQLVTFAETVANHSSNPLQTPAQASVLETLLIDIVRTIPDADTGEAWARYAQIADPPAKDRTYRKLIEINQPAALRAAAQMLPVPSPSVSLSEVRDDHFYLVATDMSQLGPSPAFEHLVSILRQRNANTEIDDLTRFFWEQFPEQWIGAQAFTIWAGRRTPEDGLAEAAARARHFRQHYADAPINEIASITLARAAVAEGYTLQALVDVAALSDDAQVDPHAQLSLELIRELVQYYQHKLADHEVDVQPQQLYLSLGEQLLAAGEPELAAALYWQSCEVMDISFIDPRSGDPMPMPNLTRENQSMREALAQFWRAVALMAAERPADAIGSLNVIIESYAHTAICDLARFTLAQQLLEAGDYAEARRQVEQLPQSLLDSHVGQTVTQQLAQVDHD